MKKKYIKKDTIIAVMWLLNLEKQCVTLMHYQKMKRDHNRHLCSSNQSTKSIERWQSQCNASITIAAIMTGFQWQRWYRDTKILQYNLQSHDVWLASIICVTEEEKTLLRRQKKQDSCIHFTAVPLCVYYHYYCYVLIQLHSSLVCFSLLSSILPLWVSFPTLCSHKRNNEAS